MTNKRVETNEEMLNEVNGGVLSWAPEVNIIAETATDQVCDCIFDKAIWLG